MQDNALFIGWNRAISGKEKASIEHFNEFLGYLGKQQQAGTLTSLMPVVLNPHGGDLNGFVLVTAENSGFHKLMGEDAWQDHITRATVTMHGFGVITGTTGKQVEDRLRRFAKYL